MIRLLSAHLKAGHPPKEDRRALVFIVICYAFIHLFTLNWYGYWSNEIITLRTTALDWDEVLGERASNGHPPLFFLIEKLVLCILPETEITLRLLPSLFGLGSVVATYFIIRRVGSAGMATFAAMLLTTTSTQLLISQMARSYTLLQFLSTLLTLLVVCSSAITSRKLLIIFMLTTAALFTHASAIIVVTSHLVAIVFTNPQRLKIVAAILLGCLWYMAFTLHFQSLGEIKPYIEWTPPATIYGILTLPSLLQFGRQVSVVSNSLIISHAAIVWTCVTRSLFRSGVPCYLSTQLAVAWIASVVAAFNDAGICHVERYFASAVACQAGIIAYETYTMCSDRTSLLRNAFVSFFAFVSIVSVSGYFAYEPFTPWREMAQIILKEGVAGEAVQIAAYERVASPFGHYFPGRHITFLGKESVHLTPQAENGIWICFPELVVEPCDRISRNVLEQFPNVRIIRFFHGTLVHISSS